jgi:beta-glucosidase
MPRQSPLSTLPLPISAVLLAAALCAAPAAAAPPPDPAPSTDEERRVEGLLSQMTLEEKIDLLGGINGFDIRGVPRLDVPLMGAADSPFGVRADGRSNLMVGGIALAATWNTALAERVGVEIGRDARARGKHFHLAPGVNIYRAPMSSRNFEYFGEDPFLASRFAVAFIKGVQSQGVSSTVKHFLGNNSEFARHTTDSVIDERALREIYLPAFEAAIREAGTGAIMSAYNLVNGEHMTQNRRLITEVAKQELGFQGVMMSDWDATYDALAAANAGLDLEMPSGKFLNRQALLPLIEQGKVSPATIDDKVRRILRTAVRFGWLDRPQMDLAIPRYNLRGREAARTAAREAMVLLKNDGNLLPLDKRKTRSVAVIGPHAHPAVPLGGGSATIPPFRAVSFLEGLSEHLGETADVRWLRGIPTFAKATNATSFSVEPGGGWPGLKTEVFDNADLSGAPAITRTDWRVSIGSPIDLAAIVSGDVDLAAMFGPPERKVSTRWTGYYYPAEAGVFDVFVQQGGFTTSGYRLFVDGKLISDSWSRNVAAVGTHSLTLDPTSHKFVVEHHGTTSFGGPFFRLGVVRQGTWVDPIAVQLAAQADAVVLAVGFDPETEHEHWDRTFALPPGQEELIEKVVAANENTILVLTSGGAVDMSKWIDRVPAILQAWYPGQEGGTALAEILFGDVNPSGHLPATFERRWEDNPVHDSYYPEAGTNKIVYKEGVFVGYRGYEKAGTKPLFPFGHGLSYTSFEYSNLSVRPLEAGSSPSGPRYEVAFDVENTGAREGADVAQVYVGDTHAKVPRPAKELKGFAKVNLRPGETKRVTVTLDGRALSYYDVGAKQWKADAGDFEVLVGRSSADIALRGKLTLARDLTSQR